MPPGTTGTYLLRVGIFAPGWAGLWHWNNADGGVLVTTGSSTTTTVTLPPTTTTPRPTTTPPPTTAPPTTTTPPPTGHFDTLPPGSPLPSSAECAALVRPVGEVRSVNVPYNNKRGYSFSPDYPQAADELARVDGNFIGTTDEIIQWAACKWGIDEDIARAQIAKESWWDQRNMGDWWTHPPEDCPPGHPPGADGRPGECPQSFGMGQVRGSSTHPAFPGVEQSSAMNLDYTYAIWRACYEGKETWLNHVERGEQYGAGDEWGCIGRWFAGRWRTPPALGYIAEVQDYLSQRIWETPEFLSY